MVYDQPQANRSSAIAAGLFNPITGKLMTKTWLAEKIFPELHRFYSWAEEKLSRKFFYPQPIYRPFLSIEEQNEWMGKSADPTLQEYILEVFTQTRYSQVNDPYGGILLDKCGYLDVLTFQEGVKDLLRSYNSYVEELFDETQLQTHASGIQYKDLIGGRIIFCNGTSLKNVDFASRVPIRLLKGETLVIKTAEKLELIYNRGVYMVPMSNQNTYKVGATYESKLLTPETTAPGREELVHKLKELVKIQFNVIAQDWGFRPTTPDRKPILGQLPGYENVVIFNGLGTKGVSLAPYFSGHLLDWLMGKSEISQEVNISRFKSLFSKSTGEV